MFHTPPTKPSWDGPAGIIMEDNDQTDQTDQTTLRDPKKPVSIIDKPQPETYQDDINGASISDSTSTILPPKSPAITHDKEDEDNDLLELGLLEVVRQDELPMTLLKYLEEFLKFLKEPRFAKPLATFEIGELFQKFYVDFNSKVLAYLNNDKLIEMSEMRKPKHYLIYKYNLLIERLLCDKFYSSIMFPDKGLSIDTFETSLNGSFSLKLSYLNKLDIRFKNLDIDLPIEEEFFIVKLEDVILPEFELFTAERSPTLKLKFLFRIHKLLGSIVKEMASGKVEDLNTDIYLPLFIFAIIKLEDLQTHSLISQLQFIKRFQNEFIYEMVDENKGQLLYVLTNLEACLSYLASVTLENLDLEMPHESFFPGSNNNLQQIYESLTIPMVLDSIDDEVLKYKKMPLQNDSPSHPGLKQYSSSSFLLDSANRFMSTPDFSPLYHADQGIRNISNAVDSSIKNIIGKVAWLGHESGLPFATTTATPGDGISESTRQQLAENLVLQTSAASMIPKTAAASSSNSSMPPPRVSDDQRITPTSSISTGDSSSTQQQRQSFQSDSTSSLHLGKTNSKQDLLTSNKNDLLTSTTTQSATLTASNSQATSTISSPTTQEKFLSKFSNSMGGVIKNFRPISASSSSSSLNIHTDNTSSGSSGLSANNNNSIFGSGTHLSNINSNNSGNADNSQKTKTAQGKMRSRTASLINPSLFSGSLGGNNSNSSMTTTNSSIREHRNSLSLFNSIENAFENVKNRSRGNSLGDKEFHLQHQQRGSSDIHNQHYSQLQPVFPLHLQQQQQQQQQQQIQVQQGNVSDLMSKKVAEEVAGFNKFTDKNFEEMNMGELMEVFKNYQYIMNNL